MAASGENREGEVGGMGMIVIATATEIYTQNHSPRIPSFAFNTVDSGLPAG